MLKGPWQSLQSRGYTLYDANRLQAMHRAPGAAARAAVGGRGSPVVKRCLVGWSGGLFMLPAEAGEDWVRLRAWWGTVANY